MSEPCSQWEERLVALLYEDGDESDRGATRAHLAECPGCRAELDDLVRTRELLSAWPNAVNVPRMVYVNERSGLMARFRRWKAGIRTWRPGALLGPVAIAAALIVVSVAAAAVLDLQVAPDGGLRVGLLASSPTPAEPAAAPVSRAELREGLAETVAYMQDLMEARSDDEQRLLLAAIDDRMQQQGVNMSQQLRGAIDDAFGEIQHQHESDLGLIFSAIDEMGVTTSAQLQRINAFLGSLATPRPGY